MLTKVTPGSDAVALVTDRPRSHTYYMGTVMLENARVRNEDGTVVVIGTVLHEAVEQLTPTHKVRGRMHKYKPSMGEITAKAAYVVGDTIYVSKEIQS